jgi:DNA-binding beta-propeller fold protein YncE
VSDAVLHKLRRWDVGGQPLDETGALGSEAGQFRHPAALARVGSLGVAVLDVENRRVSAYDHHLRLIGAAVDLAAPELEARIGRVTPVSLASDKGGAFYVADAERDRVLVFDYSGAFQREIGGYGGRAGGFSGLMAVATGPRGSLVTVERPRGTAKKKAVTPDSTAARSRVQWLDAGGRVIASVWTPAWAAGAGETAMALALDDSGRVALTGERSGELCVLSPAGACVGRLRGLASPRGVAFAADGALLVAEAGGARVRRLVLEPAGTE